MSNLEMKFEKYFFENLGVSLSIEKWRKEQSLQLFLRDLYSFHECQLLHEPCLVMEVRDEQEISPATIRKHIRQIKDMWQHGVIYYTRVAAQESVASDMSRFLCAMETESIDLKQLGYRGGNRLNKSLID